MKRLANSPSSYLRRAADEPVDWYPWDDEAFDRARREDKPVLLSIGAVWCHWCHVMARETWKDPETATLINRDFVAIKVDRDDRPEIDRRYQEAVQALTGQGGWPLTVFLTPDRKPFYGGTYFPGRAKRGLPAFRDVLQAVHDLYRRDRGSVERAVNDLSQRYVYVSPRPTKIDPEYLETVVEQMHSRYDAANGGFGTAPKFPYSEALLFLLQYYEATGDKTAWDMADLTLRKMALGGIYDQLGGGFHRYAMDAAWRVPHFEKMLNDNALLLNAYLEAFQLSGSPLFRRVAEEIVAFVFRDLAREPAGFASSIDADVQGKEGGFYVWDEPELVGLLETEQAYYFMTAFNVTRGGNLGHGDNVLYLFNEQDRERYAGVLKKLREARDRREKPYVDRSIRTSWTALMVTAFVRAFNVLGDRRCLDYAAKTAGFIMARMCRGGTLYRVFADEPAVAGYLEDYACTIEALIELFNTTQNEIYLDQARQLVKACDEKFYDHEHGGYYLVQAKDRDETAPDKPVTDFSVPAGNPQMAMNLIKLFYYTGDERYLSQSQTLVEGFFELSKQYPLGHGTFFSALDYLVHRPEAIAVVAPEKEGRELVGLVNGKLIKRVTMLDYGQFRARPGIFEGKTAIDGKPTAYFCKDATCTVPLTDREDILEMLKRPRFSGK
ncbi:MAG TPA: thioredoxin domain-containing protein [Methanocella sp.]|nr:thioredoxin domain-containing protein [Methanocella sp.]